MVTAAGIPLSGQPLMPWIALEGVNGVGKTHLARQAAEALGGQCVLVSELPDSPQTQFQGQIIAALHGNGDPFLRTGVPRTETLLLAALQVHRHESVTVRPGQVVLEDRGPHTVAVYQAAILCGNDAPDRQLADAARTILGLIGSWRPLPQKVLLLTDDASACLARFEARTGRSARGDETALMRRVGRIYELLAAQDQDDFRIIDRRLLDEEQCVTAIAGACAMAAAGISREASPADA